MSKTIESQVEEFQENLRFDGVHHKGQRHWTDLAKNSLVKKYLTQALQERDRIAEERGIEKCRKSWKANEPYDKKYPEYQTYYGAVVKNPLWNQWEAEAQKHGFDWHESVECGWLSDKHFAAFIQWAQSIAYERGMEEIKVWANEMRKKIDNHEYCKNEGERWENGYDCAMYDLLQTLTNR